MPHRMCLYAILIQLSLTNHPLVADTTRAPPRLSIFWWLEENYQTAKELSEESIRAKTNPIGDAFGRWAMTLVSCIHIPIQMHPSS